MQPMRQWLRICLLTGLCGWFTQAGMAQKGAAKLGWQLGAQAWTFNKYTFSEALDKIDSCGLKYVEMFPGQQIGGGVEGTTDFHMDAATRKKVQQMVKKHHLKVVSYGVVVPENAEDWKTLFEFAKAMDLENIVSEPKESDIPMISKLCDEYKINVAIHDHPKPSHYWNPDILLAAIKGASPRIGACADIGHWTRSGLDPMECLKKLEGHVKEFHFKDLNVKGPDAHDVPWGTGENNVTAIMAEMKRQHFRGPVSVEYEYNWYGNVPEVKQSVEFFNREADKLAK
ncbi:sugar phosphate isomerase/epimerase [Compostibacter hankyongensis]|uniref:Xylose isomerase-like TIM barrel domain-containing protein n=1 Tax=Compostibacter hankyongensis TaxID=1007089 RepID=A0ABP8G7W1_9BACT